VPVIVQENETMDEVTKASGDKAEAHLDLMNRF